MSWLIVLLALVVAFAGAALAVNRLRSASLQRQFGPEYHQAVEQTGDRRNAEAALRDRVKQRDGLDIRELTPEASARYVEQWFAVQIRFVDEPRQTVTQAAELVTRVMNERGYPAEGSDDHSTYVSVDHPALAAGYRMAEAVRLGAETATIDDQRQAIQNYRSLFDELLNSRADPADDAAAPGVERAEHDVS
ncbi:MAG TPA: hypothetical protein VK611_17275 [Acidimicrobiales bacterium]|nr:hypothetical protein [Acidimicrobiales bacterium]